MAKIKHIPTLQEFAKKRKKMNIEVQEVSCCSTCDYCHQAFNVCFWGDNLRYISMLDCCPATNKIL